MNKIIIESDYSFKTPRRKVHTFIFSYSHFGKNNFKLDYPIKKIISIKILHNEYFKNKQIPFKISKDRTEVILSKKYQYYPNTRIEIKYIPIIEVKIIKRKSSGEFISFERVFLL